MTKTTKEKGNYLEMIVGMLEKALANNASTKIQRQFKFTDQEGFDRELDIYVETYVNRKLFRYALECKNYSKDTPIKMSHIDEFHAKIANTAIGNGTEELIWLSLRKIC